MDFASRLRLVHQALSVGGWLADFANIIFFLLQTLGTSFVWLETRMIEQFISATVLIHVHVGQKQKCGV